MQVAKIRYNDIDAPAMFTSSLQKTGFGVVADHPIHFDLVNRVYREWEEFFNSEEKHLHDRIAKELGINMMTIEKNRRKKLGY